MNNIELNNTNIISNINNINIFILDFDDTLFPTYWFQTNKLKLSGEIYEKYKLYFINLDEQIYKFLKLLNGYGYIYIVSNASMNWLRNSINILPLTKKFIEENNINVISARDNNIDVELEMWKTLTFKKIISSLLDDLNNKGMHLNIISLGDAKYEYMALISLNNHIKNTKFLLKNIKFIEKPEYEIIIEQLKYLEFNIVYVIMNSKFKDITLTV
jgi:hypothetical protein